MSSRIQDPVVGRMLASFWWNHANLDPEEPMTQAVEYGTHQDVFNSDKSYGLLGDSSRVLCAISTCVELLILLLKISR